MKKISTTTKTNNSVLVFGIPLLLILSMVLIAKSKIFDANPDTLSIAITIDLLFTIPVLYFLLIKKKNISKTTIIPFFVIGMIVASYIIPKEHQSLLHWAKNWVFPFIELGVLIYLFYKVKQTIKRYNANAKLKPDFFSALKETSYEILPRKIASLLTMEVAVLYYGFIDWKKKRLAQHEFSYHKKSGTISLLVAFIIIITIETYVLHVLLLKWNTIAAWIATILSLYSNIQLFGFLKSLMKRPISIEEDKLQLRYGILSETIIDIANIDVIEITNKDMVFDTETRKLSPFGELEAHNTIITLKEENTLTRLYGVQKTFTTIAFFVDQKEEFKGELEKKINLH